ncbi:MAG: lysozyme, partial [Prevotellaceae bacterium]|nr:lysozyme [Prevotellaceae bacterium]
CQTQGQVDALTDFVFNLGIGNLKGSTLLKYITLGKPTADIQKEFERWVYCKGKKLGGLVTRRAWEARRWAE